MMDTFFDCLNVRNDLANYCGRQRAIGSRKDNPAVKDVGYADNTMKSVFNMLVMFVVMVTNVMSLMNHPCQASETKSRAWALITAKTAFFKATLIKNIILA